jgi:hypothetical protein
LVLASLGKPPWPKLHFFKELEYWKEVTEHPEALRYLVFAGSENQSWPYAHVLSWQSSGTLINTIREKK